MEEFEDVPIPEMGNERIEETLTVLGHERLKELQAGLLRHLINDVGFSREDAIEVHNKQWRIFWQNYFKHLTPPQEMLKAIAVAEFERLKKEKEFFTEEDHVEAIAKRLVELQPLSMAFEQSEREADKEE